MGGIQRRRRRMRQHQPVTPPAPVSEPPSAEPTDPEPAGSAAPAVAQVSEPLDVSEVADVSEVLDGSEVADVSEVAEVKPRSPSPADMPSTNGHAPKPAAPRPSPHHLAELSGTFAMTANVHDPEPTPPVAEPREPDDHHDDAHHPDHHHQDDHHHHHHHHHHDEVVSERGLRGLVGGGASQVSVSAAMRARDAARPTDDDIAAAERDLQIIRRGWMPREELTRPGRRSPTS